MNAKANTRNVATIRNVLVDQLVEEQATLLLEHQIPEVLYDVLRGRTYQHVIARRLQITMPVSIKLVGRVVARAHIRQVRAEKSGNTAV